MNTVETVYLPAISFWILSEPEPADMSFNQPSLDIVISFGDVKDKSNLIASEIKKVVINVSKSIGSFDSDLIQVSGTILEGTVEDKVDWSQERTRFIDLMMNNIIDWTSIYSHLSWSYLRDHISL